MTFFFTICIVVAIQWSAPVTWEVLITAIWSCHELELFSIAFVPRGIPIQHIPHNCSQQELLLSLDSVAVHWLIYYWHQFPHFTSVISHFRASSVNVWKGPSRGQRVSPSWTGTQVSVSHLSAMLMTGKVWCVPQSNLYLSRGTSQNLHAYVLAELE